MEMDDMYYLDNLEQISREANRLAQDGLFKQACTLMGIVHNQPLSSQFFYRENTGLTQHGNTGGVEEAAMRWSYRMETLRELMYDQDMQMFFNTVAKLVKDNKRDDAALMLGDFSDLLRLGLKSSSVEESAAETELKILNHYLRLSRLVSGGRFAGRLHTEAVHEWGHYTVPAMAMVPLARRFIQFAILAGRSEADFRAYADTGVRFLNIEIQFRQLEDSGDIQPAKIVDHIASSPWCGLLIQGWHEFYQPAEGKNPVILYDQHVKGYVYRLPFCDADH